MNYWMNQCNIDIYGTSCLVAHFSSHHVHSFYTTSFPSPGFSLAAMDQTNQEVWEEPRPRWIPGNTAVNKQDPLSACPQSKTWQSHHSWTESSSAKLQRPQVDVLWQFERVWGLVNVEPWWKSLQWSGPALHFTAGTRWQPEKWEQHSKINHHGDRTQRAFSSKSYASELLTFIKPSFRTTWQTAAANLRQTSSSEQLRFLQQIKGCRFKSLHLLFPCRETDALGWPHLWGVKDQISNHKC